MRAPVFRARFEDALHVDNFAGGGGTTTGLERALGRPVDVAINHWPAAIAMHQANHPETKHYIEDMTQVDPRAVCGSRPIGIAWFSPDCTHHSRAKGKSVERSEARRGLAWVVLRWAKLPPRLRPRIILVENVPGNHKYAWPLARATGRTMVGTALPYPKMKEAA